MKIKYFNYDPSWKIVDIVNSIMKIVFMLIRGIPYYFLFKERKGFIFIGKGVRIRNPRHIKISGNVVFEDYSEIQGLSKNGIKFGKNVTIGSFAMIRPSGYYGREIGEGFIIGDNSNIGAYSYVGCAGQVIIGNNVLLGPRISLLPEQHRFLSTNLSIKDQGCERGKIIIEDNCWLGANCSILSNVIIKQGSIIATGAVVTKSFEENSIIGGVPAKLIKKR